jgi:acyl-lipid omega-6 desaturase (Delta-12 desaturase)
MMLCVVWPFMVWNWVMAFVTLQHHTHPRVRWFDNETEWSYFQSQIAGTVHMTFPRVIELAFANIFEHTAHHADKFTPLYNLRPSQQTLEHQYPDHVILQRASLAHLRDILKRCRLYDYRAGRWMDFEGRHTT